MHIFIDSSVNPIEKKSVGCYLVLDTLDVVDSEEFPNNIICDLKTIQLKTTSSTDAELELALYVLDRYGMNNNTIYTDCNNLYNLKNRNYSPTHTKACTYDKLKELLVKTNIVKVKGHNKKELQINKYDVIFSYVDKQARKNLRLRN